MLEWLQSQIDRLGSAAGTRFVLRYDPAAAAVQLLSDGAQAATAPRTAAAAQGHESDGPAAKRPRLTDDDDD